MIDKRPRIINVLRKPQKCPVCGERVVDIIYGTGDMTDVLLFEKEKKVMFFPERTKGLCSFLLTAEEKEPKKTVTPSPFKGDVIDSDGDPLRQSFSKIHKAFALRVNLDCLSDAAVKVKMLKNVRKAPATLINWESNMAVDAVGKNEGCKTHHYKVEVRTELGEKEIVNVTAVDEQDAEDMALSLVMKGAVGLKGRVCTYNVVVDEE